MKAGRPPTRLQKSALIALDRGGPDILISDETNKWDFREAQPLVSDRRRSAINHVKRPTAETALIAGQEQHELGDVFRGRIPFHRDF